MTRHIWSVLGATYLAGLSSCTYGPAESTASIAQVVRVPGSDEAVVMVQQMVFRRPTGVNTFPNGGQIQVLERSALLYLVDGRVGEVRRAAELPAADEVWESYGLWFEGFSSDGSRYFRATGCPRGGECHPELMVSRHYAMTEIGVLEAVDEPPGDVGLPSQRLAPAPGETDYIRFSRDSESIAVRTEPAGEFRTAFRVSPSGDLVVASG